MLQQPATVETGPETTPQDPTTGVEQSEEIHVRNFDDDRSYDLTLSVRMDGESVLSNAYHLTPGRRISEIYQLPAGVYDVAVTTADGRTETATCEIGATPERTALIEVGNGTVSVTEGLY